MNLSHLRFLLLPLGLTLGGVSASAHRIWILPSTTVLSGSDQWISVEAAVSNNLFFPNHRPVALAQVEVRAPDGTPVELKNATGGQIRSSFELQLEQPGTYIISLRPGGGRGPGGPGGGAGAPGGGAAPAGQPVAGGPAGGPGAGRTQGDLMGTWTDNGKPQRWRGTAETLVAENMAAKPGFKLISSGGRRVVTFVTSGKPSREVLQPEGKNLEVDYITHPNDLIVGEPATFRFLMDGQPAAGAEVTLVRGDDRFRDEAGEIEFAADADGVVKIDWPAPGRYWLQASSAIKGETHGVPSEKTSTYIVTLEVLPE